MVRPADPRGNVPARPTIGARTGHVFKRVVLDIFLTCWTSAGPLRDLGPARKSWKNAGFSILSGHSGLLPNLRPRNDITWFRVRAPSSPTSDRRRIPECPDGATKPPFFQCFRAGPMSRRGPAEVPQVKKMSRIDRLKTCAVSWADGWSGRHLPYRIERTDRPTIPGRSRRMA